MKNLVPHVKRQQQQPIRPQYTVHLAKCTRQVVRRNIHYGVKRCNSSKVSVVNSKVQHVAWLERNIVIQSARLFHHAGRKVDTGYRRSPIAKVSCYLTRTAPHIANRTPPVHASGKPVEQLAVERLLSKLVENPAGILVGKAIIAFADRVNWPATFHSTRLASSAAAATLSCYFVP